MSLEFNDSIGWFEDLSVGRPPVAYVLAPVSPSEGNVWRPSKHFNYFPSEALAKGRLEGLVP